MAQTYPGIPETGVVAELRAGHHLERLLFAIARSKPRVFPMEVPLTPEQKSVLGSAINVVLQEIEDPELQTVIGLCRDKLQAVRSQLASEAEGQIVHDHYLDRMF